MSNWWDLNQIVVNMKSKQAIVDPGVSNDISEGFVINSLWTNTITKSNYVCVDSTVGAAVWKVTTEGGTGTYDSLVVNDDLTVDTTTLVVNSTTKRVSIGIVAGDGTLHVHTATAGVVAASSSADDFIVENDDHCGISIISPDDKNSNLYFGSPSDNLGAFLEWNHDADLWTIGTQKTGASLRFLSGAAAEAMRIDSSQNVGIGMAPVKVLDVTGDIRTSTGILFGTDTDAVNTLDDYEEGTWTPTVNDDTGSDSESQTYSIQTGTYTKIGNLVHIQGQVTVTSLGSLTTSQAARIAGLPFTSNAGATIKSAVTFASAGAISIGAGEYIAGHVQPGTTYIRINLWNDATGTASFLLSNLTASGNVAFSATYFV